MEHVPLWIDNSAQCKNISANNGEVHENISCFFFVYAFFGLSKQLTDFIQNGEHVFGKDIEDPVHEVACPFIHKLMTYIYVGLAVLKQTFQRFICLLVNGYKCLFGDKNTQLIDLDPFILTAVGRKMEN